jgi:diguanylate cyclase
MKHMVEQLKSHYAKLRNKGNEIASIQNELLTINFRRIQLTTLAGSLLTFSHSILFSFFTSTKNEAEEFWRLGILTVHSVLTIILIGIGVSCLVIRKKQEKTQRIAIQSLMFIEIIAILAAGVLLVSLDQIVTTSITPFLVICIILSMIFIVRPFVQTMLFAMTYGLYSLLIGIYQTDPAILLSNRVNGLSAVVIGAVLSIFIWRNTTKNLQQQHFIAKQQQELEAMNNQLALLAAYDSLTGLYNRREFDSSLLTGILKANQYQQHLSLILLDLDHFKSYNDLYGHVHGDECLRRIAEVLRSSVKNSEEVVARYGGEEFIIILPNMPPKEAQEKAQNLSKNILELNIKHKGNPQVQVISASFGVLTVTPPISLSPTEIVNQADKLLYAAKEGGRNMVVSAVNPA